MRLMFAYISINLTATKVMHPICGRKMFTRRCKSYIEHTSLDKDGDHQKTMVTVLSTVLKIIGTKGKSDEELEDKVFRLEGVLIFFILFYFIRLDDPHLTYKHSALDCIAS